MFMSLPSGASLNPADFKRIEEALKELAKDSHAPREISVKVRLHVHNEYPKHVTVGEDEKGKPKIKIVNSAAEEEALKSA
jgi:hypothetical protein